MNRYSQKRHQGPTHRGFKPIEIGVEGNIPVVVAVRRTFVGMHFNANADWNEQQEVPEYNEHCRAFYLHPTKGWRSTGPEGRR